MATARENISTNSGLGALHVRSYDIAGNKIRAFYDGADNLVFVIDDTVTPDKPNALLVINSDDDRKWDDILTKDYGVSLEMVRPKKDNKYQKLDIEYVGLDEYDDLIIDFEGAADLADSLAKLDGFRAGASRRAATDRLNAADVAAENARETMAKTRVSISELQSRIKVLRSKLSQQKKSVGREPTKQSAAKILRTESQIDAVKEKLRRAERRLDNARRRLVSAEEDAEIAREILSRNQNTSNMTKALALADMASEDAPVPAMPAPSAVANIRQNADLPQKQVTAQQSEPKAKRMAEEEVKPLFDKDPEILDEEIAFKPIDFSMTSMPSQPEPAAPRFDEYDNRDTGAPLSFTPPVNSDFGVPRDDVEAVRPSPVLDTITSVEMPVAQSWPEASSQPESFAPQPAAQPASSDYATANADMPSRPAPVNPAVPGVGAAAAAAVRPVSPVTGTPAMPVRDAGGDNGGRKPTFMYYVLLIALIALSIFTLWLYQKKNNDTVPDLAVTAQVEKPATAATDNPQTADSPFIAVHETATVTQEPAPVTEAEPAPAPEATAPVEEAPVAPVVDETVPAVPVVVEPQVETPAAVVETPFLTEPEPEPEPVKPVVVNKPVYNAGSQNENMFVADAEYDTEIVTAQPSQASAPAAPVQYQDTVVDTQYEVSDTPACDDGSLPDADGCCNDERYTDIGGGSYACCSQSTGDCFQPLF